MNVIVAINAAYIEVKGRTFFAQQLLVDNPLTGDGLINATLEHLRQTARVGVTRGDEHRLSKRCVRWPALVGVYLTIDYANTHASKTHAHLAAGYLTKEVEGITPHNMPDVLTEGAG